MKEEKPIVITLIKIVVNQDETTKSGLAEHMQKQKGKYKTFIGIKYTTKIRKLSNKCCNS